MKEVSEVREALPIMQSYLDYYSDRSDADNHALEGVGNLKSQLLSITRHTHTKCM
jgi:hypothetical protein